MFWECVYSPPLPSYSKEMLAQRICCDQSRWKNKDEGHEVMIELQEGDGAQSNAEKSIVEDGSEESEDDESDHSTPLMRSLANY